MQSKKQREQAIQEQQLQDKLAEEQDPDLSFRPKISEFAASMDRTGKYWERLIDPLGHTKKQRQAMYEKEKEKELESLTFQPVINRKVCTQNRL